MTDNQTPRPYTGPPWHRTASSAQPPERRRRKRWLAIPAAIAVLGLGGFALAQFLTQTQEQGTVTAPNGAVIAITSTSADAVISGDTISFSDNLASEVGPSFLSEDQQATYEVVSGGPAVESGLIIGDGTVTGAASLALTSELSVCAYDPYESGGLLTTDPGDFNQVVYNGPFSGFVGSLSAPSGGPVPNGAYDEIDLVFGSGSQTTPCGATPTGQITHSATGTSAWPVLDDSVEGGTFAYSLTMNWS